MGGPPKLTFSDMPCGCDTVGVPEKGGRYNSEHNFVLLSAYELIADTARQIDTFRSSRASYRCTLRVRRANSAVARALLLDCAPLGLPVIVGALD